jgi:hypothetical protein
LLLHLLTLAQLYANWPPNETYKCTQCIEYTPRAKNRCSSKILKFLGFELITFFLHYESDIVVKFMLRKCSEFFAIFSLFSSFNLRQKFCNKYSEQYALSTFLDERIGKVIPLILQPNYYLTYAEFIGLTTYFMPTWKNLNRPSGQQLNYHLKVATFLRETGTLQLEWVRLDHNNFRVDFLLKATITI